MTVRRALLTVVALLVALAGVVPAAQAHDYLVGSSPAVNATVRVAPADVTLTFDDIVLSRPARPQVTVRGPGGRFYERGCAGVSDRVVTTPVALGPAGVYTVTWRIVSADGHPVSDSIRFTYAGKPAGSAGVAAPTACTLATQPAAGSSATGGVPGAAVAAVVVIVVLGGIGAALILRRSGGDRDPDGPDDVADDEE